MKFGELGKANKPNLVVSPRHDAWLKDNSNPKYSEKALQHGLSELQKQAYPRDRSGSFSASSLNSCQRRQQFTFLGMPEISPTTRTAGIFQNGTFMHIRWQMAGLTEGWMAEAEVPIPKNTMNLKGTRDGIADDGSVIELKSINTNGFAQVNTFGPKEDHLQQIGTYVAATGAHQGIAIYEDKNTQEYREFVVHAEDLPLEGLAKRAAELWDYTRAEQLVEPLDKCIEKTGYRYTGCPFREHCLIIRDWDHAEEIRDAVQSDGRH